MKNNLNVWSFLLSFCCIPAFFIATSSVSQSFNEITGIHPLDIVLGMAVSTFFLGLIGLKDVREWKVMTRSVFTIIFTSGFSLVLLSIIFVGRLLG
ncbi:hypothetical protein [Sporosarcina sp. NPDC096371]|uniref:hypothetical protein n=1 Tax=Sporosarcina sp. NPDC096371 TaxID=3364530 RepID=UPI0037FA1B01